MSKNRMAELFYEEGKDWLWWCMQEAEAGVSSDFEASLFQTSQVWFFFLNKQTKTKENKTYFQFK